MVIQQVETFRVRTKRLYLLWFLVLMFAFVVFCFVMAATSGQAYPDLSVAPIFFTCLCFIWISLFLDYASQTTQVQLDDNRFFIKKLAQKAKSFRYDSILAHNERQDNDRNDTFNVLTVYLKGDYFTLKSNEFDQYDLLKEHFTQYGKPVPFQKVLTLTERNRARWLIGGLALLIAANIAFAYLAHNPVNNQPAQLTSITDVVSQVRDVRPKGMLRGVDISLRSYPDFTFYVSRKSYQSRLDTLRWQIQHQQPITLLIRASDYRKKLAKTEPLTFGDKFSDYKHILVFGLEQGNGVHLTTSRPVYESVHTNPTLRTVLLGFLFLVCWAVWIYIDQHKVLRPD